MELSNIISAFVLTVIAGLSTGIGSLLALCAKHTNTKFLSVALGFSAGVMIYVSFVDIFPEARRLFTGEAGDYWGYVYTVLAFFGGILIAAAIDKLLPSFENPHEVYKLEEMEDKEQALKTRKLFRMGILTALIIALHNVPEGAATFFSSLSSLKFGIPVAIAVALHNIPEGIAVSIPIYYATRSRRKAFKWSFFSGLVEPIGALAGYLMLSVFFDGAVMGSVFGAVLGMVAGIMIFISLDQLLPAAKKFGEHHLSIYGLVCGMAFMSVSLILFK